MGGSAETTPRQPGGRGLMDAECSGFGIVSVEVGKGPASINSEDPGHGEELKVLYTQYVRRFIGPTGAVNTIFLTSEACAPHYSPYISDS